MGSLSEETFLSFWLGNTSNSSNPSNSTDYSDGSIPLSDLSWQCLYIFGTVIPNGLVLYAFVFKIKERSYSNICFISLAINDLLVGCICLPTTVFGDYSSEILNFYFGIVLTVTTFAQPPIGLYTLILLTWHRLELLVWPTSAFEKMNWFRKLALVGIWIAIYGTWIVILIVFVNLGYYDSSFLDINPPNYLIIVLDGIYYFFPIFANILLISFTICALISKRKKSIRLKMFSKTQVSKSAPTYYANQPSLVNAREPTVLTNSSMEKRMPTPINTNQMKQREFCRISRDQKAIICLFTILFMNIITQAFFIINWPLYCYGVIQDEGIYVFSDWFSYSNSTASPFILFVFHDTIQAATRDMFCSCFRRLRNVSDLGFLKTKKDSKECMI